MKASLKSLVGTKATVAVPPAAPPERPAVNAPRYRIAKTRTSTRQIGGHFPVEVAQAFNVLAAEQDKDNQELLAEALTMLFKRYGKPVTVETASGRRKKR